MPRPIRIKDLRRRLRKAAFLPRERIMENTWIEVVSINGRRLPVPEVIDWVDQDDDGRDIEDLADEIEEWFEENRALMGMNDSLLFKVHCGSEWSTARSIARAD